MSEREQETKTRVLWKQCGEVLAEVWRRLHGHRSPRLYDCRESSMGHTCILTGGDTKGSWFGCYGQLTPRPRVGDEVLKMGKRGEHPRPLTGKNELHYSAGDSYHRERAATALRPVRLRFVKVTPPREPNKLSEIRWTEDVNFNGQVRVIGWNEPNE